MTPDESILRDIILNDLEVMKRRETKNIMQNKTTHAAWEERQKRVKRPPFHTPDTLKLQRV
jgi:hypothetical protein